MPHDAPLEADHSLEPPAEDEEAERIRLAKLQMLEAAAKARTGVPVAATRNAGSPLAAHRKPESRCWPT